MGEGRRGNQRVSTWRGAVAVAAPRSLSISTSFICAVWRWAAPRTERMVMTSSAGLLRPWRAISAGTSPSRTVPCWFCAGGTRGMSEGE